MPYIDNSLVLPGDKNTDIASTVMNGDMFVVNQNKFTMVANSSASIIIDVKSFKLKLAILLVKSTATVTTLSLYRDPIVTSRGNLIVGVNRSDESRKTLNSDFFDSTSVISASGNLLFTDVLVGPEVKRNELAAVAGITVLPFIFKIDTTYNLQIDNDDNSASDYTVTIVLADNQ